MSLKFTLHETPAPKGREEKPGRHARVVHDETVGMEKLCKLVSASSSFSSADVKGILEAFNFWMGFYMKGGSIIKLEGLGHFYPTLKSKAYKDEKGRKRIRIEVDTVGFRCAPELKDKIRLATLEQERRPRVKKFTPEERQKRILKYLESNHYANCRTIMGLNTCGQQIALRDLRTLAAKGDITRIGNARQTLYVLPFAATVQTNSLF
ncbi:putative histone-like DNA-binding protein [Parabacteroides sp. PF5-5]|uniref:HU family DNA-binding protein n=1 Tax=unclassified Parabacteroides TaxID=2649774 RepID=UPI002475C0D6|nr:MULTISPECIES: hypothetical protein [unclassified Parabacteroides]MDH6304663.1 putative histone-like DNA-binding protein [Parabacteroides sp. PH5-39]MDH6315723.1 putative histone-like DNA-binding protein [Parabacteroides sp. PF5-13]MDH6319383.1 putative histone-like DNA-binding protein [Parabacteroides sp. PH5-13]MDH6323114.1 putative histone-like DNA-binding protein [Parabacteroides sp. PH5-8]MDH6326916.1 putative histone-like DNA-binding protein [Parabacteroides sp. PH5-41]